MAWLAVFGLTALDVLSAGAASSRGSLLEVAILYVLITVDTPLRPVVDRLMSRPAGIFVLVLSVVTMLCVTMAGFLLWLERRRLRPTTPGLDRDGLRSG